MKLVKYIREAIEEMKKVVWPTKKQTINYSIVVIVLSLGMAVFFGVLDYGFSKGLGAILPDRSGTPAAPSHSATPPAETAQDLVDQINIPGADGLDIEKIPLEDTADGETADQ